LSDGSDDDKPLATPQKPKAASRKRKVKANDSDAEDDVAGPKKTAVSKPRQKKVKEENASSTETPKPTKGTKGKKAVVKDEEDGKSPAKVKGKGKKKERKEEEEGEVFKWWENGEQGDGSIKWNTLEHSGVYFPPPYEPLPRDVKMMYNGMFEVSVLFFLTFTEVLDRQIR
jgi:DNA topoisomerase-1